MRIQNPRVKLLSLTFILMLHIFSCSFAQAFFSDESHSNFYDNISFQPVRDVETITSAWKGHRIFAEWLVKTIKPTQIVDLGVDYGYSTLVFANAARANGFGTVTGIDLFEGDTMTGLRNTHASILEWIDALSLANVEIIKGDFNVVSLSWERPIDILHIDGYHSYEAVYKDFMSWNGFVREDGIILFHDINVANPEFEVINFFRNLSGGHKLYFLQSFGLGIYTKNDALYNLILNTFPNVYDFDETPL